MNQISILFGAIFFSILTHAGELKVALIKEGDLASADQTSRIILKENGWMVTTTTPEEINRRSVYLVRFPAAPSLVFAKLSSHGSVLDLVPGEFAIMEIKPENLVSLASTVHAYTHACGGVMKLDGAAVSPEIKLEDPKIPVAQKDGKITELSKKVVTKEIEKHIVDLSAMFTRDSDTEDGKKVAPMLATKYQELAKDVSYVKVMTYDHGDETPQKSLVVRIEGKDDPNKIVIIGSHIDSINYSGGRAPGTDDNASGTAANLEVFRILMQNKIRPLRTIEIHGYAAEELGLIGSADMAKKYKAAGVDVVAMLQNDMNLYKEAGSPDKMWFVTNGTNIELTANLKILAANYSGIEVGEGRLDFGTSDHASWRKQGYAVAFPTEHPSKFNRKIHTIKDDFTTATALDQSAGFARLSLSFLMHYAGFSEE